MSAVPVVGIILWCSKSLLLNVQSNGKSFVVLLATLYVISIARHGPDLTNEDTRMIGQTNAFETGIQTTHPS